MYHIFTTVVRFYSILSTNSCLIAWYIYIYSCRYIFYVYVDPMRHALALQVLYLDLFERNFVFRLLLEGRWNMSTPHNKSFKSKSFHVQSMLNFHYTMISQFPTYLRPSSSYPMGNKTTASKFKGNWGSKLRTWLQRLGPPPTIVEVVSSDFTKPHSYFRTCCE